MIDNVEVRRGTYHDSVRLMQASRVLQQAPGVEEALVAMATDLNHELLAGMGFDLATIGEAGPNDLIVAVRAADEESVAYARQVLEEALVARAATDSGMLAAPVSHVVGSAAAGATLALISVPGEHAFVEAMDALDHGLDVMVFSDNVPVAQEVLLKEAAGRLGLLVMGPDCGTAIVNGVGLGFANIVQPGPVGIVGAAGTGIQQLCCLLDDAGVGVRNALGTGSHDLSVEVGGSSTLRGLAALDADPSTEVLIVVSKPPAAEIAAKVRQAAEECTTPTVLAFLGEEGTTLEGAVSEALKLLGKAAPGYASWPAATDHHRPGTLRGLFSGAFSHPDKTYLMGKSMGGNISVALAERNPNLYDGVVPMCGVVGGTKMAVNYIFNLRLLFDYFYPGVIPGSVTDVPEGLDAGYAAFVLAYDALVDNPLPALEMAGIDPLNIQYADVPELITAIVTGIYFQVGSFHDFLARTHGHDFFDNSDVWYFGSNDDAVLNADLPRFTSTPDAEAFLRHWYEPTGKLKIPAVTIHTTRDEVVQIFQEDRYFEKVSERGYADNLVQHYIDRFGHCAFSLEEILAAFNEMVAMGDSQERRNPRDR